MNMKTVDRQKLDAINKTRSNVFGCRGQFSQALKEAFLALRQAAESAD